MEEVNVAYIMGVIFNITSGFIGELFYHRYVIYFHLLIQN